VPVRIIRVPIHIRHRAFVLSTSQVTVSNAAAGVHEAMVGLVPVAQGGHESLASILLAASGIHESLLGVSLSGQGEHEALVGIAGSATPCPVRVSMKLWWG
jgi:hypothetical protein